MRHVVARSGSVCVWNRNRTNGRTSAIDQREIKFIYTENYFGSNVMVGLARSLPRLEFILDRMKNRQKNIYKRASTTTTSMTMSSAAIAHQFFIFFWLKSGKQKFGNGYYVRSMFSRINNTNSWSFSRALTGPDNDRAFRIARCVQEHAQKNVVFPRRSHTHTHTNIFVVSPCPMSYCQRLPFKNRYFLTHGCRHQLSSCSLDSTDLQLTNSRILC